MKVSVITVVYNDKEHIENTILSVINQTYKDIEFIVIDGGSSDGTTEVIEKYSDKISYYVSEPDKGIYDAMNKGIKFSHGKWLNFMNAGDTFFDDNVLEKVMEYAPFDERVKVLFGNVFMIFNGQNGIEKKLTNIQDDLIPFSLNHQSTFIDGDWMRLKGYDTSYRIAADANFFYETYKNGFLFKHVPIIVTNYESSMGVSAVNQMNLFHEMMRIKGVNKFSLPWLKGFVRALIFGIIHKLPCGLGGWFMECYVKIQIR